MTRGPEDGGTRSAIAQQLPEDMTVSFDAQAVVDTLQVLERYDVARRNTWKPGRNFHRAIRGSRTSSRKSLSHTGSAS
ncbi:hypothetical protein C9J85_10155 [Haloferax sp. wsp5]|nr:hypothetical protein C9J85_10155 [Haloferax sp. wsp5]